MLNVEDPSKPILWYKYYVSLTAKIFQKTKPTLSGCFKNRMMGNRFAATIFFNSCIIFPVVGETITEGTPCAENTIQNAQTHFCELPVSANCTAVASVKNSVGRQGDDGLNCVANSHCKLIPGEVIYKCSCDIGYVPSENNTVCRPMSIWTDDKVNPKVSLLLKKAREPRYRPFFKESNPNDNETKDYRDDLILSHAPSSLQVNCNIHLTALLAFIIHSLNKGKDCWRPFIVDILRPWYNLRGKVSKIVVFYLFLMLLAPTGCRGWNGDGNAAIEEVSKIEEDKKCPYSTTFNDRTGECNSKIGDPCQVNYNMCGLNTDCLDSRCTCMKDFLRAYESLDCLPSDIVLKDRRNRAEFRQSWRRKDNPESRAIECKTNPKFSPKCAEFLKESLENDAGALSIAPFHLIPVIIAKLYAFINNNHK